MHRRLPLQLVDLVHGGFVRDRGSGAAVRLGGLFGHVRRVEGAEERERQEARQNGLRGKPH